MSTTQCQLSIVHGVRIDPDKSVMVMELQRERQYESITLLAYGRPDNPQLYLSLISPITDSFGNDDCRLEVPDLLHRVAKLDCYEYHQLLTDAGYSSGQIPSCRTDIICQLDDSGGCNGGISSGGCGAAVRTSAVNAVE